SAPRICLRIAQGYPRRARGQLDRSVEPCITRATHPRRLPMKRRPSTLAAGLVLLSARLALAQDAVPPPKPTEAPAAPEAAPTPAPAPAAAPAPGPSAAPAPMAGMHGDMH